MLDVWSNMRAWSMSQGLNVLLWFKQFLHCAFWHHVTKTTPKKKGSWQTNGTLTFVAVLHTTVVGFMHRKLPCSNLTARFSWCNITVERTVFTFSTNFTTQFKFPNLLFQRKDSDGGGCVIGEKINLDKEIQTEHPLTWGSAAGISGTGSSCHQLIYQP